MAINPGAVIKGGLLAGLVINIGEFLLNAVVAADWMNQEMAARNLPPMGGGTIGLFVVMCFGLGLLLVWLYAAIRARFGPGAGTAIRAGLVVWALAWAWPSVTQMAMGMFSVGLAALGIGWGLAEVLIASLAGAYVYQEGPIS